MFQWLETGSLNTTTSLGRKQAEANFNIGVALEKRGDLSSAVEYLETFYTLSMEQEWQDKMGDSLHDQACLQVSIFQEENFCHLDLAILIN